MQSLTQVKINQFLAAVEDLKARQLATKELSPLEKITLAQEILLQLSETIDSEVDRAYDSFRVQELHSNLRQLDAAQHSLDVVRHSLAERITLN